MQSHLAVSHKQRDAAENVEMLLLHFSSFNNFNQAIETATWQQIKQYDNSVAGAYKIVDANGNIIYRFFAWLIQFLNKIYRRLF